MPVMRSNSWIPSVFNDLFDTDFRHEKGGLQRAYQ